MSKSISFRLKDELVEPLTRWLQINSIDESTLCNLAIQQFITSEQMLHKVELMEADDEATFAAAAELMDTHRDALDRLK